MVVRPQQMSRLRRRAPWSHGDSWEHPCGIVGGSHGRGRPGVTPAPSLLSRGSHTRFREWLGRGRTAGRCQCWWPVHPGCPDGPGHAPDPGFGGSGPGMGALRADWEEGPGAGAGPSTPCTGGGLCQGHFLSSGGGHLAQTRRPGSLCRPPPHVPSRTLPLAPCCCPLSTPLSTLLPPASRVSPSPAPPWSPPRQTSRASGPRLTTCLSAWSSDPKPHLFLPL